jgi:uncharacterized repeat protein (TIGR02543 family)
MGPDAKRLVGVGDFNAEISNVVLLPGVNQLVITAIDTLGEQTDHSVTVEFFDGITWEMPYMTDWSAAIQIADQACVVDGKWHLTGDGVRTDTSAIGYDRLIVLGDYRWLTDYEVTVPMTFHAGFPVGTGFGIAVGWHGHMENPAVSGSDQLQPLQAVRYQAIGWVRDVLTDPVLHLLDNDVMRGEVALDLDPYARHIIKMRSEYISPTVNQVSVKIWEDGTAEPDWQLTDDFDPVDGSVMLIAHQADVTFGNVEITPLSSFLLHTLTANVAGNGTIERVPDYASYSDSSQVELTAVPDAGWVFDGWSGGLSGNDNPITLTMVSDTTVTANFIPEGFKVKIQIAGTGTVLVDPDEERYADGDTVIITAVPGDGFYFYGWSRDHEGDANPDTIEVTSDLTIVATFFGVITGVDSPPSIKELTVLQNSPNPFTQKTDFQFGLPDPSDVEIRVYDVAGKRVFSTRITEAPAGWNRYLFNGRDGDGKLLPSGVYFYRIQAKDAAVTNKMVILR